MPDSFQQIHQARKIAGYTAHNRIGLLSLAITALQRPDAERSATSVEFNEGDSL